MPGLYGNVGNTTVSGGNTTSLYNTSTYVTVSNNINVNDINASGNLFVAGTGTFGGNVTAPNFIGNLTGNVSGNISGNVVAPGSNTQVIYNDSGSLGADPDFTWNESTNTLTVTGAITATGNVSGAYILGNGSQLTGLPATYGNADVQNYLANGFGSNTIVTTGNISAGYFLGNGSQLTGIVSSYGNANVAAYLPTYTGNLAGGNLAIGNNATINNDLTVGGTIFGTFSGNITGNLVVPGANTQVIFNNAGNAGASADFTFNDATDILAVNGSISLTKTPEARISGSEDLRIFAAAAQDLYLSNPSIGMANIWLDAQDIRLARTLGGSDTNVIVTGQITTTGNVTGANIIGNGQYLTNLPGANVTGTVANATYATNAGSATTATHATTANTVTDAAQGNITSLGTLTALTVGGDQNITGNLIVGQNLTVNGNTIQVNITELNVQDPIIGLGRGENNAPLTSNDGKDRGEQLWYYAGSEKSAFTGYDNSAGNLILATDVAIANEIVTVTAWGTTETGDLYAHGNITGDYVFGNAAFMTGIPAQYGNANVADFLDSFGSNAIVTTGNVTAGYFFGDGSGLTNINAGNIVGSYGNANVANFLANYGSNTIVTTGNISGGNVIGTFLYGDGTNITGVVAGAASTRIEVKNTSGVTITKGTPVYATGTVGASTIIEIAASRADTASTMPCLGLLAQDLNNNDQGYAISVGTLTSTNTNGFTTGQELYVAAAGGLTASRPTGTNIVQTVGIVGRVNASNGSIEVNVWNVNSLPNLGNGNVWIGNANGFPTQQVAYGDANVAAYLPTYTGNLAGGNITVTGVYYGNGSGLTSLTGANVTGTVANATYATSAGSAGTATTAVTVTGNAQANITSVGTLTSLSVTGNTTSGNLISNGIVKSGAVTYTGTDGTAGQVLTTYGNGITYFSTVTSGGNSFSTIDANGTSIVADSSSDTLTLAAGSGITITGNATTDTITIAATGGSYGNANVSNFLANGFGSNTITTTGNITASNLNATTAVVVSGSAGNITGANYITANYFVGNGSQLTGITTSLSGNLAGNIAANGFFINGLTAITITGNANVGNLGTTAVVATGAITGSTTLAITGNANVGNLGTAGVVTATGNVTGGNVIATGTVKSGAVTITGTDGTNGQVLTTYGNGITYFSTVSGGGGTPGGADTQIQFNDSSAFAGNAQMTFSKTTGNAAFGNLVIQTTNPNNAAVITNVNALNASARPLLARIAIGSGFNGDFGNTGDYFNTTRNSAVTSMNRFDVSSTSNTTPMAGTSVATWFNNTSGNTITAAGNARGMSIDTFYTGSRWGTAGGIGAAAYNGLRIHAIAGNGSSAGNVATLAGLNLTTGTAGSNSTINDNINLIINQTAAVSGANNGNVYGVTFSMNSTNPTVGNTYLIHNQASGSGTHNSNWGIGGNFRSASRYFFIRNDDDVSQVRLGSLRTYHELLGNATQSTSSITIGPRQGPGSQVVRTTPTEAITSVTFTGFITSASDGTNTDWQTDTMTWIIQQGATPYAITMPTGNAQIKYAGGVSTIGTTANAVTMCAITAYDNAGTTNYLVTISPEFT